MLTSNKVRFIAIMVCSILLTSGTPSSPSSAAGNANSKINFKVGDLKKQPFLYSNNYLGNKSECNIDWLKPQGCNIGIYTNYYGDLYQQYFNGESWVDVATSPIFDCSLINPIDQNFNSCKHNPCSVRAEIDTSEFCPLPASNPDYRDPENQGVSLEPMAQSFENVTEYNLWPAGYAQQGFQNLQNKKPIQVRIKNSGSLASFSNEQRMNIDLSPFRCLVLDGSFDIRWRLHVKKQSKSIKDVYANVYKPWKQANLQQKLDTDLFTPVIKITYKNSSLVSATATCQTITPVKFNTPTSVVLSAPRNKFYWEDKTLAEVMREQWKMYASNHTEVELADLRANMQASIKAGTEFINSNKKVRLTAEMKIIQDRNLELINTAQMVLNESKVK